jgi:hypothetical protein
VEFVSVAFLVAGLVAVAARFGAGVGPVRLPGFVDRSIGMYLLRQLRGTLERDDLADAEADRPSEATPVVQSAPTATQLVVEAPAAQHDVRPADPRRRDRWATTPARLAAIGVKRAEPIRRPPSRRPISLAARSVTAARLTPLPAPPFWRRLALGRPARTGRAGSWKQAELATAAVVVVIALVAVAGLAAQPSPDGGVLGSTGRPRPTASGGAGGSPAAPTSPAPSRAP